MIHPIPQRRQSRPTVIPTRMSARWQVGCLVTALVALLACGAWIDSPPSDMPTLADADLAAAFEDGRARAAEELAPAMLAAWRAGMAQGQTQCARVAP